MTIDETQFLPRNEPIVNKRWIEMHSIHIPFAPGVYESSSAWVKIGTKGEIAQAAEKDLSILMFLLNGGWVEHYHIDCALSFMELQHAYLSKSTYKSNSIYMAKFNDLVSIGRDDIEKAYEFIGREIGRKGQRIVEYACTHPCDIKSGCQTAEANNVYRQAMDMLLKASDEIWRTIQDERLKNAVA